MTPCVWGGDAAPGGRRYLSRLEELAATDTEDAALSYGVVVDCGSSGSRVFVYVWPPHNGDPHDLLDIRQMRDRGSRPVVKKIKPGTCGTGRHRAGPGGSGLHGSRPCPRRDLGGGGGAGASDALPAAPAALRCRPRAGPEAQGDAAVRAVHRRHAAAATEVSAAGNGHGEGTGNEQ